MFFNNAGKDCIVFIDSNSYFNINANSHGQNNTVIRKKETYSNSVFMELDGGS